MAQNIQDLIDKIKTDGLESGRKQAQEIEHEARRKADEILAQARNQADKILADARSQQDRIEESTRASLAQTARDTVLSLTQTINDLLMNVIRQEVGQTLDAARMSQLIMDICRTFQTGGGPSDGVEVGLSEKDWSLMQKDLLAKLQTQIKGGVTVRAADDLTGGFTISFDQGKSCFDFSQDALVEYLSRRVNQYVAGLLK